MNELRASELLGEAYETAPGMNDYEIARLMGVSRSLIFQTRLRAMKKLRAGILRDPVLRQLAIESGCNVPAKIEEART